MLPIWSSRISDQGVGIPEERAGALFDGFYRGSNVGNTPGTGLGLAITRRCVELLGGTIALTSAPDHGTTFTVTLPLATAMTTLLLIEDDPTMLRPHRHRARTRRIIVRPPPTAAPGSWISRASSTRPYSLRRHDARHGRLRRCWPPCAPTPSLASIPFIFLTARGEKKDLRHGMVSGADDYLTKPVALDELLAAIRARLARHAERAPKAPDFSNPPPSCPRAFPEGIGSPALGRSGQKQRRDRVILGITEATVKKHLENIFAKLGVEKRGAARGEALKNPTRHHEFLRATPDLVHHPHRRGGHPVRRAGFGFQSLRPADGHRQALCKLCD